MSDTPGQGAGAVPEALEIHPRVLTGALIIGLIIALVVGAASFKLSFSTLLDLAVMAGVDRNDAWVIPVALDGPILAAATIRIALTQHVDAPTKFGRRFVVSVLVVSALLSIAGNAYHAVLTDHALLAVVAALIAAIAPLMVLTMSEVVAVVLRAPRARSHDSASVGAMVERTTAASLKDSEPGGVTPLTDGLADDVWRTVGLHLADTARTFSSIALELQMDKPTVSKHITQWIEVQRAYALSRDATELLETARSGTLTLTPQVGARTVEAVSR